MEAAHIYRSLVVSQFYGLSLLATLKYFVKGFESF
jgi:hypothetical protein